MRKQGFFSLLLGLMTSVLFTAAYGLSSEEANLLRTDYKLYQAWSLSRDYYFGTTLKPDRISALAWQQVYVKLLPDSYPKKSLLQFYEQNLTSHQIHRAQTESQKIMERYQLRLGLTENQLKLVYPLRDEEQNWDAQEDGVIPHAAANNFRQWLQWLASNSHELTATVLQKRADKLLSNKQFPIVYGQIVVAGPEIVERVSTTGAIKIVPEGYFIGQAAKNTLSFALPGYKTVTIKITRKIQPIPLIILKANPHSKKTGMVGRVLPWPGMEAGNIVLFANVTKEHSEPWLQSYIPLTITNEGIFYTTGLAAGRYVLFLTIKNLSTKVNFSVKEGEIKGLGLIDFRKNLISP